MARRKVRDWSPDEKVADATVAPDRYNDPTFDGSGVYLAQTWAEMKAAFAYKPGDVIYVERYGNAGRYAVKGRVVDTLNDRDRDGWRRELYTVQFETKAGLWAKVAEKVYPGYIERGYQLVAEQKEIA